jgi:hypothetical protein
VLERIASPDMISALWRRTPNHRNLPLRIGAGVGVGVILALACLRFTPQGTLVILSIVVLTVATLKRPEIGVVAILVATSSIIFEERLPLIPIGIGSLHVSDVVLLALLGLIAIRSMAEPDFRIVRTPLDIPLLAFFGMSLLATSLAIGGSSVEFNIGLRGLRVVTYYLVFFVVTNLITETHQVRLLLRGLLLLAAVVAVAMIAQSVVGDSVHILPGRVETLSTQGTSYAGVSRILPPGQSLLLVAFMTTSAGVALCKPRAKTLLVLLGWGLFALGLVFTFNRSYWVAMLLGLGLLLYLVRGADRKRFLGHGLVLVVFIGLGGLSAAESLKLGGNTVVEASVDRLATLVNRKTLQESSLQFRYTEIGYAIPAILSHPVIGLGLGARYRPWDARLDWQGSGGIGFDGRAYIHNGHLWILLTSGGLGYLSFMVLSYLFLRRGFESWKWIPDRQLKSMLLGFTLTYLGVVVGDLVNPMFMQWYWSPVIGIMMGCNEVVRGLAQAGRVNAAEKREGIG